MRAKAGLTLMRVIPESSVMIRGISMKTGTSSSSGRSMSIGFFLVSLVSSCMGLETPPGPTWVEGERSWRDMNDEDVEDDEEDDERRW